MLKGKIALVTGASRGIGRAIAVALAAAGADVVVNYHATAGPELGHDNAADAANVTAEIEDRGGRARAVPANVADRADVETLVATAVRHFGGLDILVNNAGICPFHDFLSMPEQLWDEVHAVNLKGAFLASQAAARVMVQQQRGGRIISISSISALVGGSQQAHYTPAKAGVHSLMQSLAIVLGPHGITCNSVMPGAIATSINSEGLATDGQREAAAARIPLGRVGVPEDVAGPVVFLASDAAAYVNGASLLVDGGMFVNLQ